jgi:hypothetical protein
MSATSVMTPASVIKYVSSNNGIINNDAWPSETMKMSITYVIKMAEDRPYLVSIDAVSIIIRSSMKT